MNKLSWTSIIVTIFMIGTLTGSAFAGNDELIKPMRARTGDSPLKKPLKPQTGHDALSKLGRGITNILEGPCEFYVQTTLLPPETETIYAVGIGLSKGFGMFLARELSGIYDIVTFPIPLPAGYKPLMEPPTPLTDLEWRKSVAQSYSGV